MARHTCDNCGTVVVDEQFCPKCGAWVDPLREEDEVGRGDEYEEFSLGAAPPSVEEPAGPVRVPRQEVQCPSCGAPNPVTNRHCEECGARLSQGALPVAPRPAVQATAGVRAAMMIAGLLLGVVLIAVLFNIFTGGGEEATTTTAAAATTSTTTPVGPIEILDVECSVPGLSGFDCRNLIDGGDGEYQINWEELAADQPVTIRLIFAQPYVVRSIEWVNLAEGERFLRNYRAKTIVVKDSSPNAAELPLSLEDRAGSQVLEYVSFRTLSLELRVTDVYAAQEVGGNVYSELAVQGIRVIGRPDVVEDTTTTTTTTGG